MISLLVCIPPDWLCVDLDLFKYFSYSIHSQFFAYFSILKTLLLELMEYDLFGVCHRHQPKANFST